MDLKSERSRFLIGEFQLPSDRPSEVQSVVVWIREVPLNSFIYRRKVDKDEMLTRKPVPVAKVSIPLQLGQTFLEL